MRYEEWIRDYEQEDPEPPMVFTTSNEYNHKDSRGELLAMCGDLTYSRQDVDIHMDWHKRMTDAYMKVKHLIPVHQEVVV